MWCAHCVHLSDDDVADFAASGTGVAHCPTSNLRLGAGVAPVRELVDAGVRVGLGVDGSASNERSDLLFEVKQALLARAQPRRPVGADRTRGAPARDARRRGRPPTRRHRLARAGKAGRPRRLAHGRPRARGRGRSRRRPRPLGAAPRRPPRRRRRGRRPRRRPRARRRGADRRRAAAAGAEIRGRMSNARLRLRFVGEPMFPTRTLFFPRAWGTSRMPTPLHAHRPRSGR